MHSESVQVVRLVEAGRKEFLSVRSLGAELVIDGPMCRTDVRITFQNDLRRTLEGDLVFPLPPFSALCELVVKVGARTLRGKFRGRQRAQAEYHRAVQAGKTAALSETEGEDLCRLRVAPIEDGEDVEVRMGLVHALTPVSNGHRLILPLTYMPRYVEDQASLKPIERAAVERPRPLTLAARADVKVSIRKNGPKIAVRCTTHKITINDTAGLVEVSVKDAPLDRDLHLEIGDRDSGEAPTVWVRHDPSPGPDKLGPTTAVALLPPPFAEEGVTVARSVILLVDRSGSMSGEPIAAAVRAVRGCLRALGPADEFNIVAFSDSLRALSPRPLPFSSESLQLADSFVGGLSASGGTDASAALRAVLHDSINQQGQRVQFAAGKAPPSDGKHRLRIVVMMTDGDVGGAEHVLRTAEDRLVDTRLFVIGIGESVNHAMLGQLASLGSGTYTPVSSNEDLERALHKLKNTIDAPILTGVTVRIEEDGEHKTPAKLEPASALDLFAGYPLLLAFRGELKDDAVLHITAQRSDGEDYKISVPVGRPEAQGSSEVDAETAALLWALLRNRRLTYRYNSEDDVTLEALGTAFGLLNRRVALIGVHDAQRGAEVEESVPVVLPLPANLAGSLEQSRTQTGAMPPGASAYLTRAGGPPPPAPAAPAAPSSAITGSFAVAASASMPLDIDEEDALASPAPYSSAPLYSPAMSAPPPPPSPPKKKGVFRKLAEMISRDESEASTPKPEAHAPPPPRAKAPPPAAKAPPRPAAAAAPIPHAPAPPPAAPRFTDDEAGLRRLLLEQGADGIFGGELAATVLSLAVLCSRGHTARAGSFRAELRRTSQALKSRLSASSGDDRLLCAVGLGLLLMPHGEAAPTELPADLAALLSGKSPSDPPALRSAVEQLLGKLRPELWQSALCKAIRDAFLRI